MQVWEDVRKRSHEVQNVVMWILLAGLGLHKPLLAGLTSPHTWKCCPSASPQSCNGSNISPAQFVRELESPAPRLFAARRWETRGYDEAPSPARRQGTRGRSWSAGETKKKYLFRPISQLILHLNSVGFSVGLGNIWQVLFTENIGLRPNQFRLLSLFPSHNL